MTDATLSSDQKFHVCPTCRCQFVQPFVCTTCGAEKLYDATVRDAWQRLTRIKDMIDSIENRCMAADGPVTNTRHEMTDDELRRIYVLAGGNIV